jgi:hypothetical protein
VTDPGDLRPRPDPTVLTAEAVRQAKEDLRREIRAEVKILEARLDSMDHARALLLQIMNERSADIDRRFKERDLRFDERDKARRDAVQTALAAAKELSDTRDIATDKASAKFESTVKDSLSQLGQLAAADRDQLSTRINGLKERIDRGEGGQAGAAGSRSETRLNLNSLISAGVLLLAVVTFILLYVTKK